MTDFGIASIGILLVTTLMTYRGIQSPSFTEKYLFHIDRIIGKKEYYRIITSGFLHAHWTHFFFNMITFYFFQGAIESALGMGIFLLIYLGSMIGGNLLALFIHRNHGSYRALGASGAVSGLLFASIGLFPGLKLRLLLIPIPIYGWLFGLLYVIYSIYGIRSQRGNIGHEAHLGGGIMGLLIAVALFPEAMIYNPVPLLVIFVPAITFLLAIVYQPHWFRFSSGVSGSKPYQDLDEKYHEERLAKERERDRLLEKIHNHGYQNLTEEEKRKLDELSR